MNTTWRALHPHLTVHSYICQACAEYVY